MEKNKNLTKQQIKNRKKKNAAKKKKETSEKTEDNVPNTNGTAANKEETVKEVNQTAQDDDNFEEELCWCIQQIEIGLRNQKATKDQVSKSEKLMAQLKSKKNPKPKKRMLMRSNFGNYRQNMNKEMKQQAASPVKMIEVDEKAMKKSVFFKKKASDLLKKKMNEATKKQEKNARKREKAKEKKLKERVEARKMEEEAMATNMVVVDPTIEVKQQLAEAKASGDHKLAAKLRQDLWVLQDASTGHSIKLDSEDIKESMNRLEKVKTPVTKPQQSKPKQLDDIISSGKAPSERKEKTDRKTKKPSKQQLEESTAVKVAPEKEIKKLKKKLEQIERLKQKEASGETLEECQAEKISKESEFKELLAKLEKSL